MPEVDIKHCKSCRLNPCDNCCFEEFKLTSSLARPDGTCINWEPKKPKEKDQKTT